MVLFHPGVVVCCPGCARLSPSLVLSLVPTFASAIDTHHMCTYTYCGFLLSSDCCHSATVATNGVLMPVNAQKNHIAPISAWKGDCKVNIYTGKLNSFKKERKA